MKLHFIIQSPFYTERIIEKIHRISPKDIFVIVDANRSITWCESGKRIKLNFGATLKSLRKRDFSCVYIHFLSTSIAYLILKSELQNNTLAWVMWGADFYRLPSIRNDYILSESKSYLPTRKKWVESFKQGLSMPSYQSVYDVLAQINYFVGYKEEYDLVEKTLGHNYRYVPMEYYFSLEEMPVIKSIESNQSILIGNSDDPNNNHLDILKILSDTQIANKKIILPIAGASKKYTEEIKRKLDSLNFDYDLIQDTLPLEEFTQRIEEISYVIYGHLRQQGVGTLIPQLYAGKKVFLWESNPFYNTLLRWGIHIFSLDNFDDQSLNPLSDKQVAENKNNLEKMLNAQANHQRLIKILSIV